MFKTTSDGLTLVDQLRCDDEAVDTAGMEQVHILQDALIKISGLEKGKNDCDAGKVILQRGGSQAIDRISVESTAGMLAHQLHMPTGQAALFALQNVRYAG